LEYEYALSSDHEHRHKKNEQKNEESENYPILKPEEDKLRVKKDVKMKPTTLALP